MGHFSVPKLFKCKLDPLLSFIVGLWDWAVAFGTVALPALHKGTRAQTDNGASIRHLAMCCTLLT
jgi:hypothetical protein